MDRGAWWAAVHGVAKSWAQLSNFTFAFHFHALEKEMATHFSILAWRIPGTEEPSGLRLWSRTGSDTAEVTLDITNGQMFLPVSQGEIDPAPSIREQVPWRLKSSLIYTVWHYHNIRYYTSATSVQFSSVQSLSRV